MLSFTSFVKYLQVKGRASAFCCFSYLLLECSLLSCLVSEYLL